MSDPMDKKAREEGRARARSTAVFDPRLCSKSYWDYLMTVIPHDAIGADMTKHLFTIPMGPKLGTRTSHSIAGIVDA